MIGSFLLKCLELGPLASLTLAGAARRIPRWVHLWTSESCCHACAAPIVTNCSKNGRIEAAPTGRLRCADASATFSWLQLTDLPIQLRLVRGLLLNHLPVSRHFTSHFFDLHSGFLSLRFLRRLLLCANGPPNSAKRETPSAFRLCSISDTSFCYFSSRRCFCSPRPNSSYRSLFACPW